jgi:two-component system chemotaxis response regulator CheY
MIADDSGTARLFTKRCVQIAGHKDATIIEAVDGADAWSKVQEDAPDLLLTDLTMPNMDGTELLRNVKTTPAFKHIPVIVVTSAGNPAKEKELVELGAAAVILKPISPPKLVPAINKVING